MNKVKSVLFSAGISLALALTFSCSSGGGGEGGGLFNENSQIYTISYCDEHDFCYGEEAYKGSGVIKWSASGEYEILIDAGIVTNGVVNLNLPTNLFILDEYLYDFLNDDEQSSCTSYPKDIKVIGRWDKGYTFELSDNNGKYIGDLSLSYHDEQIYERIEYVYFSKAGKIACNLQYKDMNEIINIYAKKGWNVLYSTYNRSQDTEEISTNKILTKEKEMKWKIYLED